MWLSMQIRQRKEYRGPQAHPATREARLLSSRIVCSFQDWENGVAVEREVGGSRFKRGVVAGRDTAAMERCDGSVLCFW